MDGGVTTNVLLGVLADGEGSAAETDDVRGFVLGRGIFPPAFLTPFGAASDPNRLRPFRVPPEAEIRRSLGVLSPGEVPTDDDRLKPAGARC